MAGVQGKLLFSFEAAGFCKKLAFPHNLNITNRIQCPTEIRPYWTISAHRDLSAMHAKEPPSPREDVSPVTSRVALT